LIENSKICILKKNVVSLQHRLARQSLSALLLREHEPDGAKRFLENTSQIWWFEKFVLPLQRF
jgi:hypothetical protein